MTYTYTHDLAIVGAGISGSLLLVDLIQRALADGAEAAPQRIALFDRRNAFGAGVAYGEATAEPGFLLIEAVADSTPPAFQAWLMANRQSILAEMLSSPDAAARGWAAANAERFAAGRLDQLCAPRRLFGRFVREQLDTHIALAERRLGWLIERIGEQVIDLDGGPAQGRPFVLGGEFGQRYHAATVVLATGCIPRPASPWLGVADGYLNDLWEEGYAQFAGMISARHAAFGRPLDLVMLGSGATACEALYYLAHQSALRAQLRSVLLVSRSGYLSGGALSTAQGIFACRAGASARPAGPEYVAAARSLAASGLLDIRAAWVRGIPARMPDGRLRLVGAPRKVADPITADVVLNCMGSGLLGSSASPLLRRLSGEGGPCRINSRKVGWVMQADSMQPQGLPGCYVIGPMLNQRPIETHVESILGVYRALERLAPVIHERLLQRTPCPA